MTKKKVLIIGASSYIGQNINCHLNNVYDVIGSYNTRALDVDKQPMIKIDLAQDEPFNILDDCKDIDTVIWSVQSNQYSQALSDYADISRINIAAYQKTLDFCIKSGVKRLIYLSSGSVYQAQDLPFTETSSINYTSHYGFSKFVAEEMSKHYTRNSNLEIVSLRLFTVYGEKQYNKVIPRIVEKIEKSAPIQLNSGVGMRFTPIYIDDLVEIIRYFCDLNLSETYSVYNVASSEVVTLFDACQLIGRELSKPINIHNQALPAAYSVADNTKLLNAIGSFEFTSFGDGIKEVLNKR